MRLSELAAMLWPLTLLRGLAALALGAYVVWGPPRSPAALARAIAAYWIIEGAIALCASLFAASLTINRALLVVRAVTGIAAAALILSLPLADVFGQWHPGQTMLLILTVAPALFATCLQILLAATIDLMLAVEVRRRILGEWSVGLGAVLSMALGVLVVASLVAPVAVVQPAILMVTVTGGIALAIGAFRLKTAP